MLIGEFLSRLHATAALPDGAVTPRMLEDWGYEDLITGPRQTGGAWHWSEESFSKALEVLDFRSRGFRRTAAIKVQRWLENDELAASLDRNALRSEIVCAQKLLIRFVTSTHGFKSGFNLTEYRARALASHPRAAGSGS